MPTKPTPKPETPLADPQAIIVAGINAIPNEFHRRFVNERLAALERSHARAVELLRTLVAQSDLMRERITETANAAYCTWRDWHGAYSVESATDAARTFLASVAEGPR